MLKSLTPSQIVVNQFSINQLKFILLTCYVRKEDFIVQKK